MQNARYKTFHTILEELYERKTKGGIFHSLQKQIYREVWIEMVKQVLVKLTILFIFFRMPYENTWRVSSQNATSAKSKISELF